MNAINSHNEKIIEMMLNVIITISSARSILIRSNRFMPAPLRVDEIIISEIFQSVNTYSENFQKYFGGHYDNY